MRISDLLWLPVKVLAAAVKVCIIPAVIALLAWWLLPAAVAKWVIIAMVAWAVIVLLLLATKVSGQVRSLGRGPLYLRNGDGWL